MTTFQEAFDDAETSVEGAENEEAVEEAASVEDEGQADESAITDTEDATETSYFDLEAHGDSLVQVKVDGVEQDVALKDLPNGYMMGESFTQKSQALASEREELTAAKTLADAYQANPQETVRFLAQQAGLTVEQAEAVAEEIEDAGQTDSAQDPRIAQLDQRLQRFEEQDAKNELEQHLQDLGNRYGEDFVSNDVVNRAIELQSTDIEGTYKMMAFDRFRAGQDAQTEAAATSAADDAKRAAAKGDLAGTVASGDSSFGGAGDAGTAQITTVADALEQALAGQDFNF